MKIAYDGKLILFTTFYEHRAYSPYIQSMVETVAVLDRLGVSWDYWPSHGSFHLERAVNGALTKFMNDDEATDILLIDSDESWDAGGIIRLLLHPEEVVGGTYRMKNRWEHYISFGAVEDGHPVGKMLADGTALLKTDAVAGGFMRIKKSTLKKFHDAYPELRVHEKDGEREVTDTLFFEAKVIDGLFHSHDVLFCRRLREIGIDLWIDPLIRIDHWGMTRYEGNYDKFLRNQHALNIVREMSL
jgi:hypothetical protein